MRKRAEYTDKYIKLAPDGDEQQEALIEMGDEIYLNIALEMKNYSSVEREKELLALAKNCDKKNFRLYFHVNYKLAKVRKKRAEC